MMRCMTHVTLTLRIPTTVKEAIKRSAEEHGRSLNNHAVTILDEFSQGKIGPTEALLRDPEYIRYIEDVVQKAVTKLIKPRKRS